MSTRRWLALAAAFLVIAAGGTLWWLHANLDALVRRAIVHYGSTMTQAPVAVAEVRLSGTEGHGAIRGLQLGNPRGFTAPYALKVDRIEVAVDLASALDDVVVVRRIVVDRPDVIYEQAGGTTNFEALQRNIAQAIGGAADKSAAGKPARRLIVEELVIRNAQAQAVAPFLAGQRVNVRLPDIVLRNVGRKEGGVTPARLGQIVAGALTQRLTAQISFDRLLRAAGEGGKSLGDTLRGWFGR